LARNQGYTYNPATFSVVSYGVMKAQAKEIVHSVIRAIDIGVLGREFLEKIHGAILNGPDTAIVANASENEGGVVINRLALVAEFYLNPALREEQTPPETGFGPGARAPKAIVR
jgi:hypothetical protein